MTHRSPPADHHWGRTCGRNVETIARDSEQERWFTAAEAREYGLVDRVVESLADIGATRA